MPHFGKLSRQKLEKADGRLIRLMEEVVKRYDISIIESHRSPERQELLYRQGMTKVRAGKSKHNTLPAKAVDILPYPFSSNDWRNMKRFYHLNGYVTATCHQLQWDGRLPSTFVLRTGLDWDIDNDLDDQLLFDGPHYEILENIEVT